VPIYLHPTLPHPDAVKAYFEGYEELARAGWGFAVDTSCHFLRIVFAGVFDAYPRLRIILGHLGEGLPFAMHRLNDHTWRSAARRGLRKTPLQYIRENLLVTTSGNWYEPAFLCTLLALGADNILFAIDWPYEANKTGMEFLRKLSISDSDKEKIAHGNAERLLGLYHLRRCCDSQITRSQALWMPTTSRRTVTNASIGAPGALPRQMAMAATRRSM